MNPVVNLWATDNWVNKLSSWANISFSGMALSFAVILSVSSLTHRDVSNIPKSRQLNPFRKGRFFLGIAETLYGVPLMQISGAPFLSLRYPECFLQLPSQIERAALTGKSRGVYRRNQPYLLNLILLLLHGVLSCSVAFSPYDHRSIVFPTCLPKQKITIPYFLLESTLLAIFSCSH